MITSLHRMVKRELEIRRFMAAVEYELREGNCVVILYAEGSSPSSLRYKVGYPMHDAEFRNHCLSRCREHPKLRDPKFMPPDEYDGWVFSAYIKERGL